MTDPGGDNRARARESRGPQGLTHGVDVTAVVVTHGWTEYLEETLSGLAAQTRAPQQVLVVDVDPAGPDRSLGSLVARHWSAGPPDPERAAVVGAPGAPTFGEAVRRALAGTATTLATPGTDTPDAVSWVWLLHDDSAPEPEALAALLRAVELAPSVGVAGAKQRTWSDPPRVLEVGFTTSRFGRRMTGIDDPELDQGQHDGREDVLAVGTAGALVRRDVWDELGGPDPALGPYGDGLDLSRRARLAGHRVVVVPGAVVRHAQASLAQPFAGAVLNRPGWDARRSAQARREAYLHQQLAGVPLPLVPVVSVLAVLAGLVRGLGRLVTKEPHLLVAELLAPVRVLARPARVVRARRRAARSRRLRRSSLRPLQVTWRDVWRQARDRRLAAAEARRTRQAPSELELAELAELRTRRRAVLTGVLLTAGGVTAVTLGPTILRVVAGDRLSGGATMVGDAGVTALWAVLLDGYVSGGLGHAGPTDPLLVALAPLAALTGSIGGATALVLLGSVVLSATGAWFAAGAATRSTALRAWASLVWASAPALLLGLDDLRLGAVLAHVTLPWVGLGLARGLGVARIDVVQSGLVGAQRTAQDQQSAQDRRSAQDLRAEADRPATVEASLAAVAGAGLALAVVTAGAPVLLPAALVALVVIALVAPRRRRLLWVAVPSLALHGPVIADAVTRADWWRVLLAEPGQVVASTPAETWVQAFGWPAAPSAWATPWQLPAVVLVASGLVVLPALLALVRSGPRGGAVRVAWLVAAVGLLAAAVTGRAEVGIASGDPADAVVTPGWSGPGLSLVLAALLGAALLGADGLQSRMARYTFGWRQLAVGALALVVAAGPALLLAQWTWTARLTDPTQRLAWTAEQEAGDAPLPALRVVEGPAVPAVGRQMQTGEQSLRVVSLRATDHVVDVTVLHQDGAQLTEVSRTVTAGSLVGPPGESRPAALDPADAELAEVAAALATGTSEEVAVRLAELGVGAVLVPPGGGPQDEAHRAALVGHLDSTLALERMTETPAGIIWRVAAGELGTTAAWARVQTPDGTAEAVPSSRTAGGTGRVSTVVTPGEDRLLLLAERADDGWRAWLDGRPLRAVDSGWRQAFELGTDGGRLTVGYAPAARTPWLVLQGAVLLVTVLLAIPVRRRRGASRW